MSFLGSQEQQAALWRIRGWSRFRLGVLLLLQFLALALLAVLIAFLVALAAAWFVAHSHNVDLGALGPDLASTLIRAIQVSVVLTTADCVALTARFAMRSVAAMRTALARSAPADWWQWRRGTSTS